VTVFCLNIPYRVNVINDDGKIISEEELAKHFHAIVNHAENFQFTPETIYSIGILTTENRDTWAAAKQQLAGLTEENKKIWKTSIVVC